MQSQSLSIVAYALLVQVLLPGALVASAQTESDAGDRPYGASLASGAGLAVDFSGSEFLVGVYGHFNLISIEALALDLRGGVLSGRGLRIDQGDTEQDPFLARMFLSLETQYRLVLDLDLGESTSYFVLGAGVELGVDYWVGAQRDAETYVRPHAAARLHLGDLELGYRLSFALDESRVRNRFSVGLAF